MQRYVDETIGQDNCYYKENVLPWCRVLMSPSVISGMLNKMAETYLFTSNFREICRVPLHNNVNNNPMTKISD